MNIQIPKNLPSSKEADYFITIKKDYDKIVRLLYSLGSICTYDQFKRLYKQQNPEIADSYIEKKTHAIIKEMEQLKLIGTDRINRNKFLYLKKFALTIVSGDYNNYKRNNIANSLKDKNFKINLLKVEYYIDHNEIISLDNLTNSLLNITKYIYNAKKNDAALPYDLNLLKKIIDDKGIKNCFDVVNNLSPNNLIRVIWIDLNNIYTYLRLQNQTVSSTPFYLKLFKKDNRLTLHYAPTIIIFDVFNINYYSKKIKDLFYKYFNITSNHTRDMQMSFKENGTLGWEGFNHFGYTFKLIGFNELELLEKKKFIDSHIKNNPNAVLLTNCEFEYVDISKYFLHSSKKTDILEKIDTTFDKLLAEKFNNLKD